jgi:dTMP kinase
MRLIVMEGLDGAGKSTQVDKLKEYLETKGEQVHFLHFPRTDDPFYGEMIARFLRGELGALNEVDPYLVALLYAGDRAHFAPQLQQWLDNGHWVILDRYVYSNIAFQCAKLKKSVEREKLAHWILNLEFDYHKIPRPSLNVFLDVPFSFTENKLKSRRDGADRDYLNGQSDIHEADLDFQRQVREVYLWLAQNGENVKVVDCSDKNGEMLPPDTIASLIRKEIA